LPWLFLALVALAGSAAATAQELEVIELRYRLAEEVIPILKPIVSPGGVLTGTDRMLFVRTSPANLEQIRQALAMLDRKPRQVSITVGQSTGAGAQATAVRGAASVGSGDVQVGVNAPPGASTGVAVGARSGSQQADLDNVSTVRALEGTETWIAVGQVVPLPAAQVVPGPRSVHGQPYVEYRDVSTGFYATVRLGGDFATLEISPRQQRLQSTERGPAVATAGSSTTVSGRLGEWIPLGAVSEAGAGGSSGLLVWGRRRSDSQYSAWVRVDEVP
jgi:type II secretory pathway component GspD/PulD (secretin)